MKKILFATMLGGLLCTPIAFAIDIGSAPVPFVGGGFVIGGVSYETQDRNYLTSLAYTAASSLPNGFYSGVFDDANTHYAWYYEVSISNGQVTHLYLRRA